MHIENQPLTVVSRITSTELPDILKADAMQKSDDNTDV